MSTDPHRQLLIKWLEGAYTLEKTLSKALTRQAKHAREFPELQARLHEHTRETKRHCELVKHCLEDLGAEAPELRAKASSFAGAAQAGFTGFLDNTFVKDTMIGAASEELEISMYQAIIALAEKLGEDEIASICSDILEDERAMLAFFHDNLPQMIRAGVENNLLRG